MALLKLERRSAGRVWLSQRKLVSRGWPFLSDPENNVHSDSRDQLVSFLAWSVVVSGTGLMVEEIRTYYSIVNRTKARKSDSGSAVRLVEPSDKELKCPSVTLQKSTT